jgi:hypothetical protein
MATAQTVINAAARKLSVFDSGNQLTAQQTADAIEALNNMMAKFESDGIALGWTPAASAATTITAPDYTLEAIEYLLALRIAPEWGVEPSIGVQSGAKSGMEQLKRQSIQLIEADMQHLPRRIYVYNINNG